MKQAAIPDYANWIPRKMVRGLCLAAALLTLVFALSFLLPTGTLWLILRILLGAAALFVLAFFAYMARARRLLSYEGGGVQGKILDNVLNYLAWNGQGTLLDIGCGSGALTIKAAKKFREARCVGMDYWGAMWDYAQVQCERNARLEGVADRITFQKGDAAKLDFPDGTFDAAVSNFVFHEVRTQPDKAALIREALRVLKPGAPFAFEDIFFSPKHYPDLDGMLQGLSKEVSEIRFVDTRQNNFVPRLLRTSLIAGEMGLICGRK
jgi:SAM-dependent methyltransferase